MNTINANVDTRETEILQKEVKENKQDQLKKNGAFTLGCLVLHRACVQESSGLYLAGVNAHLNTTQKREF